jgi:hypothetical protein
MLIFIVGTIVLGVGCTTHSDQLRAIRSDYYSGNLTDARTKVDNAIARKERDADVFKLDRATILLTEGKPKEAESLFREVRDRFEEKEGRDLREGIKAMLADDQQLAYSGEDYEKVLIRFMLSLSNLFGDGSDAAAYALQVNQKQQQIITDSQSLSNEGKNLKQSYKLVPAGAYLHAALREETHTNYDDVARSLELVARWQPDFTTIKADLERAKNGRHSQPGHGAVYVFAMVGRGPYKEEVAEPVTQVSLLIADRLISAFGKQTLPPTIAPVKVPKVVRPVNPINNIVVGVGNRVVGQTATLTDVGQMAFEQCEATLPDTIARAVVRRVVKKGVVYSTKEAIQTEKNGLTSVALDLAGVVWEASESADTRCWGLLPDKIQVIRLELPTGQHTLTLQPKGGFNGQGLMGQQSSIRIQVQDGRNTYVLANYPSAKLTGQILTNMPGQ